MATRTLIDAGFQSGLPLYKDVRNRVLQAISLGEWRAGDALPTEKQLCVRFGVSMGTLRKAVDDLTASGVLIRQQGRGTFVARHSEDRYIFSFFHLTPIGGQKEYPKVEFVSYKLTEADEYAAQQLELRVGAPLIQFTNRLRLSGNVASMDEIYLPTNMFPSMTAQTIKARQTTLYQLYQDQFDVTVIRTTERLRVGRSSSKCAKVLGITPGSPVLEINRVAYSFNNRPVELRLSHANTEVCEYIPGNFMSEAL
jgi:GntR family transcriptional regulator